MVATIYKSLWHGLAAHAKIPGTTAGSHFIFPLLSGGEPYRTFFVLDFDDCLKEQAIEDGSKGEFLVISQPGSKGDGVNRSGITGQING
jgi:hypothetical protein